MSSNPYCKICFSTLGLNDGFNPEIEENIEIENEFYVCKNCLCKLVIKYNNKYDKKLNVLF